jgi:protein TonB
VLQALVTRDGAVRRINIVKSSGYDELDESAVQAVWLWHFTVSGAPRGFVEDWIEIPIDFRLH